MAGRKEVHYIEQNETEKRLLLEGSRFMFVHKSQFPDKDKTVSRAYLHQVDLVFFCENAFDVITK